MGGIDFAIFSLPHESRVDGIRHDDGIDLFDILGLFEQFTDASESCAERHEDDAAKGRRCAIPFFAEDDFGFLQKRGKYAWILEMFFINTGQSRKRDVHVDRIGVRLPNILFDRPWSPMQMKNQVRRLRSNGPGVRDEETASSQGELFGFAMRNDSMHPYQQAANQT